MKYTSQIKTIFVAITLLIIAAISTSVQVSNVQSAIRSFVDEEGNWAKTHRDAYQAFIRYQHSNDLNDFNVFTQHLSFNRGINEIKTLLDNGQFEPAKNLFMTIGTHPNNANEIVYFYNYFSWLEKSEHAFEIWDKGNELIASLELLAQNYRDSESLYEKALLLQNIEKTQKLILKAEQDFELVFIELAEQVDYMLTVMTILIFSILGLVIFTIIIKSLNKITEKDELYQATFNKSQIAYIQFKLNGDLMDANQQFLDLIKCNPQLLTELNFFNILQNQGNPSHLISTQSNNKHQDFQFKLGSDNGQNKYFLAHTTLIHNYSGTPLYFVAAINDISKEKAKSKALKKLAHNDFLTGLMNKFSFENLISDLIKQNAYGYLLYMDLNGFKSVNDQAGHLVGDKILEQVTQKIKNQLPNDAPFARMGGDEFALFLENITLKNAFQIANNIRHVVSKNAFTHELNRFDISISIGISGLTKHPTSIEDLISHADNACYSSKENNKVIFQQNLAKSA